MVLAISGAPTQPFTCQRGTLTAYCRMCRHCMPLHTTLLQLHVGRTSCMHCLCWHHTMCMYVCVCVRVNDGLGGQFGLYGLFATFSI
jgi:hypothetical protein